MKKAVVASLAAAMVIGVAGISFAASNPFVDVPANHWSYASVTKLAQAGIVDGYGDSTFRGDKVMSRYEMAQITAKAMAHSDKADAAQKAEIDKLAVEFADELAGLNVRVTTLEKNQPNMKFNGTFDVRYKSTDFDNKALAGYANTTGAQYRLRMEGSAKVDDKTTLGIRFVTQAPDTANFKNDTWLGAGADATSAKLDRVFATTKIGAVDTTIGRQKLQLDPYNAVVDSGAYSFDGVKAAWKMGNVGFTAQHGRLANKVAYTVKGIGTTTVDNGLNGYPDFTSMDVDSFGLASKAGHLDYGVTYATIKNNNISDGSLAKYWIGNATYTFSNKFSLGGQYVTNREADNNGRYYAAKAILGNQALVAKGQNNFVVQYSDVQASSLFNRLTTLDTPNFGYNTALYGNGERFDNYKVLDLNYNYAFSKNFLGQLQFVKVDDKTNANFTYNYFKATTTFKF